MAWKMARQGMACAMVLLMLPLGVAQDYGVAQDQEALPLSDITENSGANCTFKAEPEEFLSRETRNREEIFERMRKFKGGRFDA
jgi:hypothetical protein